MVEIINGFEILDCEKKDGKPYVLAVCPMCGNAKWMRKCNLNNPKVVSCGCYLKQKRNSIKGKRFGELTALYPLSQRNADRNIMWHCRCSCGKDIDVPSNRLTSGNVTNCGCKTKTLQREAAGKYNKDETSITAMYRSNLKNNTSGVKGVSYFKSRGQWVAYIMFKKVRHFLGYYSSKEEAIKARKAAEVELFGSYAKEYATNYPEEYRKIRDKVESKFKE